MKKIGYIMKEMAYLIRKHRLYVLSPVLLILNVLAVLFGSTKPTPLTIFIYAGV